MVMDELVRPVLLSVPVSVGWKLNAAFAPPAEVMAFATVNPLKVDVVVESVSAPVPVKPGTPTERTPVLVMEKLEPPTKEPGVAEKERPVPFVTEEVAMATGIAEAPVEFPSTEFPAIAARLRVAFVPPT
jgi:hypothetical protein